jgi:hypothetical protein
MSRNRSQSNQPKFNKLEIACLGVGLLPIPIISEICFGISMYKMLGDKDMPLAPFADTAFKRIGMSAGITGLTKLSMYELPIYKTIYQRILNAF